MIQRILLPVILWIVQTNCNWTWIHNYTLTFSVYLIDCVRWLNDVNIPLYDLKHYSLQLGVMDYYRWIHQQWCILSIKAGAIDVVDEWIIYNHSQVHNHISIHWLHHLWIIFHYFVQFFKSNGDTDVLLDVYIKYWCIVTRLFS